MSDERAMALLLVGTALMEVGSGGSYRPTNTNNRVDLTEMA